jgi:hypothetical protein
VVGGKRANTFDGVDDRHRDLFRNRPPMLVMLVGNILGSLTKAYVNSLEAEPCC